MRLEGEGCQKALKELLETIPLFLGGDCNCPQCRKILGEVENKIEEVCTSSKMQCGEKELELEFDETVGISLTESELHAVNDCNHVLRSVLVGILMFWIVIAFLAGLYEPDSVSLPL